MIMLRLAEWHRHVRCFNVELILNIPLRNTLLTTLYLSFYVLLHSIVYINPNLRWMLDIMNTFVLYKLPNHRDRY